MCSISSGECLEEPVRNVILFLRSGKVSFSGIMSLLIVFVCYRDLLRFCLGDLEITTSKWWNISLVLLWYSVLAFSSSMLYRYTIVPDSDNIHLLLDVICWWWCYNTQFYGVNWINNKIKYIPVLKPKNKVDIKTVFLIPYIVFFCFCRVLWSTENECSQHRYTTYVSCTIWLFLPFYFVGSTSNSLLRCDSIWIMQMRY